MLAALAAASAPAAAQTLPGQPVGDPVPTVDDNDDLETASAGVAGLAGFPGRGLQLNASFLSRYEDNLARRPVKDDGWRLRPSATATYGLGAGRLGFYATGTYGRDIIVANNILPATDRQRLGAGVAAQLSRCNIDAGASYARYLVLTTDIGQFGGIQQRTTQGGALLACRFGSALRLNASATFADIGLARGPGTSAFDSRRWTYTSGLSFTRPALGTLSVDGSLSDMSFTGRFVVTPTGQEEDGLLQRSIRLGWSRQFGSRLTLTLGGSYLDTGPKNDGTLIIIDGIPQVADRSSFSGGGYDAALLFRLTPRLALNARAGRSVRANNFIGAQFSVVDNLQLSTVFKLKDGITMSAGWDQLDSRFRSVATTALERVPRNFDKFDRYFANINARLGRRLRLALDVSHNQRRSDPAVFNFDSTGVGLTIGFELGKK